MRHDGSRDQKVADDVGGEQVAEAVRADLPEAYGFGHEVRVHGAHADAGVVDQYVDATEACYRAVDAGGDGLLVANVHDEPGHLVATLDPGGGVLDTLPGPAGQDDAGSGFGQRPAHGEAQAAGAPGDDCANSFEIWRQLGHIVDVTVVIMVSQQS